MTATSQRRWTLFLASTSAALIALVWAVYYVFAGQVPMVNTIFEIKLPFELSRGWDFLIGPIYSISIVYLFRVLRDQDRVRTMSDAGFISGTIMLTVAAMLIAAICGLFTGVVLYLIICLIAGPAWVLKRPATKRLGLRFVGYLNDEPAIG